MSTDSARRRRALRWFRFWSRRDIDAELSDEIGFHIERTISELRTEGWSLPDAEREAYRRFGDVDGYRRRLRRLDEGRWKMKERRNRLGNLLRDLAYAARALRREPALAAGITLTLALGIGANAIMFGIVDRLLLSGPEHLVEPDGLRRVVLEQEFGGQIYSQGSLQYADYTDVARLDVFESVAGWHADRMTHGYGENARRVDVVAATASLFPTLGVRAARGRFFSPDEDRTAADPVAVVGHEFWTDRLGADPDAVGQDVVIAERAYRVIGVAPAGFTGLGLSRVDVWLPLHVAGEQMFPGLDFATGRESAPRFYWLHVVGRLAPGVESATADARVDAAHQLVRPQQAEYFSRMLTGPVIAGRGSSRSDASRVSVWLTGVAAVVLLVACANVANMLLARGVRRRGEIAVRMALGVPRGRLIRQLLAESVLLATLGGVAALWIAAWGGAAIRAVLLPDVVWTRSAFDLRMLAFTAAVVLLTGFAAGLLPALQWSRQDVMASLKSDSRGASGRSRTRQVLLVAQAALSVLLLTGAGLFVRSLQEAGRVDFGFDDPAGTVVAIPEMSAAARAQESFRWPEERILERLRGYPAVSSATAAITTPFGNSWAITALLPGKERDEMPRLPSGGPYIHPVASDYFSTLGLRVLAGRALADSDRSGTPLVAVVNRTMARLLWPDGEAVGECILLGRGHEGAPPPCTTVVGVVENARRDAIDESETMQYYVPLDQRRLADDISFLVRLAPEVEAGTVVADIRREIQAVAPSDIRYVDAYPLQSKIDPQARAWQLGATLFTVFGLLAAVVAAIGLYAVLAFDVAQRTREMGVRAALGARASALRRLVLAKGLRVTGVGIALGLAMTVAVAGRVEDLLFRVEPRDPVVLGLVALLLLVVATIASWLPATRVTRIDPNIALRRD